MACNCERIQCECIECGNTYYKINVTRDGDCMNVFATPCSLPSAVFEIARICERHNSCTNVEYYECVILTDPVEIIIDCDLCCAIRRALTIYIDNVDFTSCSSNNNRYSFFGF